MRSRTASAISLRDQGRFEEAQALFSENLAEINQLAGSGPLSTRMQYLQDQYNSVVNTPRAAASRAWDGQRKYLRQMDANPVAPGSRY